MATSTETLHMILSAEDRSSSILGRVGLSIGAITAAVAGLAAAVKHVANVGDELDKLSIKVGVSVESLSALKLAADLNDVSLEEVRLGLNFLQRNLADAAAGGGEAAKALQEMGFSQANVQAGLKDTTGFLEAFALRLFQVGDPAKRTQLAMDTLGRSAANLLPLLQDLSERGMKGLRDESDRLGVTWTKQMTEASQRFNDSLTRLGASMSSLKIQFIAPLIQSLADLADKFGLGGPEAQKRVELQSRANAIAGVQIRLHQQLQVAEELRQKGVRTGIASDEIHNQMLKTRSDLIAEHTKVLAELGGLEAKRPAQTGLTDPAAAAAAQQIGNALTVLQQRVSELFKSGLAPTSEELKRMLETFRQAEAQGRRTFGIALPETLQKTFSETEKWVQEIAKAGGIDLTTIARDLPALLQETTSAGGNVVRVFDEAKGQWKIINDQARTGAAAVADELGGWNSRLDEFDTETEKIDLPKSLDDWKKRTTEYGTVIDTLTGQQRSYNLTLAESIRLTNELTRARSGFSAMRSLSEDLKRDALTSNEPK